MSLGPIKLLIVDDHPMVIEGLKTLLHGDESIEVAHYTANGEDTLTFLNQHQVDVILLDVNLPDINGVELVDHILAINKRTKVIGLSTYSEPSIINQMIKNGVKGYLLKNATADVLSQAIHTVYEGQFYFGSEVQKILASSVAQESKKLPKLTRREKHILRLIAQGQTTKQIAEDLFISPLTVETHRRNLMRKMEVTNAAAMVKAAIDNRIIE